MGCQCLPTKKYFVINFVLQVPHWLSAGQNFFRKRGGGVTAVGTLLLSILHLYLGSLFCLSQSSSFFSVFAELKNLVSFWKGIFRKRQNKVNESKETTVFILSVVIFWDEKITSLTSFLTSAKIKTYLNLLWFRETPVSVSL